MATVDEFVALMGRGMVLDWLKTKAVGWSLETIAGFLQHGIPDEYARALEPLGVPYSFWPKVLHPPKALHKRLRGATVNSEMNTDHRQAISRSRPGDEAFRKAIGRYTQNELAKAVGISPATLSFYRNGRKVPKKVADDVERLTGFKATAKNWPGGIHGE